MASPQPDDLDLRGLDLPAARDYVLAHARTLKEAEQRVRKLADEARLWSEREALARSRGREDLAGAAATRAAGTKVQLAEAEAEAARLRGQVNVLKDRLRTRMHGEAGRSVDSERLEAELEMLVGDGSEARPAAEPQRPEPEKGPGA